MVEIVCHQGYRPKIPQFVEDFLNSQADDSNITELKAMLRLFWYHVNDCWSEADERPPALMVKKKLDSIFAKFTGMLSTPQAESGV